MPPKAISFLILLVQSAGQFVGRETLRDTVWGDAFVEEAAITRTISTLRLALAPYLGRGGSIETLPKRGYRFVADVSVLSGHTPVPSAPDQTPPVIDPLAVIPIVPKASAKAWRVPTKIWLTIFTALVLSGGLSLLATFTRHRESPLPVGS